jgi:hypothetical protein
VASRTGRKAFGERARFFDLRLPSNENGGFLGPAFGGAIMSAEDRRRFVDKVESTIAENHGLLLAAWVENLLANDRAPIIRQHVDEFIELVAGGENGLEGRIARKFGVVYAAGVLAVEAGLLPWPPEWPLKVVRYCYDLARDERDPDRRSVERGIAEIARSLKDQQRFPKHSAKRGAPFFGEAALGLMIMRNGRKRSLLCQDRLRVVGIHDPRIQKKMIEKMRELGMLRVSGNATSTVQMRVRAPDGETEKQRFWRLRRDRMLQWAARRSRMEGGA